jgi:two-component sensor histidine kinase
VDIAVPCGLIINELVSNALKHAFPDKKGEIKVGLHTGDGVIKLQIADNGVGIPEDMNFRTTETLGLRLVTILAEDQLKGEIRLNRDKGTEFCIVFRK